ncbi:MAG: hypothetical protein ACREQY_05920, partial [Candidatus Binatia bacterium]
LEITKDPVTSGGMVSLGGTERWADAQAEVELAGPPKGQFWVYLRRDDPSFFLRLGVVDQRIVLQKSDSKGQTRQLAAQSAGSGPVRLGLRVIGSRALAFLNDEPLLDRPTELASKMRRGSLAFVVWNESGEASARVRRVDARPLPRRFGIVAAAPSADAWDRLRRDADDLWAVSPRAFAWNRGKAATVGTPDLALRIFVRHHHMEFLPAVTLRELPTGPEWSSFARKVREWGADGRFDGVNVILEAAPRDPSALAERLGRLRSDLVALGKDLVLTLPRGGVALPVVPEGAWFAGGPSASASFGLARAPLVLVGSG